MKNIRHAIFGALLGASLCVAQPAIAQTGAPPKPAAEPNNAEIQELARDILRVGTLQRNSVMARLVERGDTDVVPALIQSLRFLQQDPWTVMAALESLTGENFGKDWNKWMLW